MYFVYFISILLLSEVVKQMEEEIFLGLDVGTNSCGWALTDSNYQLKKINKKDAWGVRLFNEAQTKEKRRLRRTTRPKRI